MILVMVFKSGLRTVMGSWSLATIIGACALSAQGNETVRPGLKDVLPQIYVAALKADSAYMEQPCEGSDSSQCRVIPFHYRGDILFKGERQAVLQTDPDSLVQWLSIQGTDGLVDGVVDADIGLVYVEALGMEVHKGFYAATEALYKNLLPHLRKDCRIRIAGHSLGGAMSILMANLLVTDYRVESCITFGQPKVTNESGSQVAAKRLKDKNVRYIRVVDELDIVPKVPPIDLRIFKRLFASVYFHFGDELHLGDSRVGLVSTTFQTKNWLQSTLAAIPRTCRLIAMECRQDKSWRTIKNFAKANIIDHFMVNYIGRLETLIRQNAIVFTPYAKLKRLCPEYPLKSLKTCLQTCFQPVFQMRQLRKNEYSISIESECREQVELEVRSLSTDGANPAPILSTVTATADSNAPKTRLALSPNQAIQASGGWVRLEYHTVDSTCASPVYGRQYLRAAKTNSVIFRVGAMEDATPSWTPTLEWNLIASSFWLTWLEGTAEFGLTALKPVEYGGWRDVIRNGSGQFDPFQDQGRLFQARLTAHAYPVPASFVPSFMADLEFASQPGGSSHGTRLYPGLFAMTQMDIPTWCWTTGWRWGSQPLGLVRAGFGYNSLFASLPAPGKGDYQADWRLEVEIGRSLVKSFYVVPVLRLVQTTPIWDKQVGPSLLTYSALVDIDVGAMGRIFGIGE